MSENQDLPIYPRVNLNGTSRESLLETLKEALNALQKAQTALSACSPHGRDYQTIGDPKVISQALDQHHARIRKLQDVYDELTYIAVNVYDQGKKRKV